MIKAILRRKKTFLKRMFTYKKRIIKGAVRKPVISFFIFLAVLLALIIVGSQLRKPEIIQETELPEARQVKSFNIGTAPRVSTNAKIEKSGVTTVVAQTSGVVSAVLCVEGEEFGKGHSLVSLASNYQGGNAFAVQRQIASASYENAKNTFDLQKEIIGKQRDIANNTDKNNDELREITEKSVDETKSLITLNENTIDILDDLIQITENATTPTTTAEKTQIAAYKQQKSGLLNGLNAAKSGLRNAEYSADEDNAPSELSDSAKDIALKQLDLQEKTLELNKEIALLQLRLAQINEGLMSPAAPFSGRVERVHVEVGQVVNPGDPIATISGSNNVTTATAFVSKNIAENISRLEESTINYGSETFNLLPTYVSTEPTNGQLFTVLYTFPETSQNNLTEGQFVSVDIPVGYPDTQSSIPFIPLDAIYQTQEQTFVFVNDQGLVQSREVVLGNIFGSFVEIQSGIEPQDVIILDRSVVAGDPVTNQEL